MSDKPDTQELIKRLQKIVIGMANEEEDAVLDAIAALIAKPDTPSADTKELVVALDWVLSDYEGMCTEGFPPSANWNRRVDSARKAIQALQPQGDKP